MFNWPLFRPALVTLCIVAALDLFFGIEFHLFYTLMWFDMPMHFLGGFFISISALAILTRTRTDVTYGQLLLWGVGCALVVGILWEFFELYYGITYFWSPGYWGDNGMDVTMDTFGGLSAVWYSYFKIKSLRV